MDTLLDDLLKEIFFSFTMTSREFSTLRLVCKKWNRILISIERKLVFNYAKQVGFDSYKDHYFSNFLYNNNWTTIMSKNCVIMKIHDARESKLKLPIPFVRIIGNGKDSDISVHDNTILLDLEDCDIKNIPCDLKYLYINEGVHISGKKIMNNLKRFILHCNHKLDVDFSSNSSFPKLEFLKISSVDPCIPQFVYNCKNLQELEIDNYSEGMEMEEGVRELLNVKVFVSGCLCDDCYFPSNVEKVDIYVSKFPEELLNCKKLKVAIFHIKKENRDKIVRPKNTTFKIIKKFF